VLSRRQTEVDVIAVICPKASCETLIFDMAVDSVTDLIHQGESDYSQAVARPFRLISRESGALIPRCGVQECAARSFEGQESILMQPRRSLTPMQAPCNPGVLARLTRDWSRAPTQDRKLLRQARVNRKMTSPPLSMRCDFFTRPSVSNSNCFIGSPAK